MKLNMHTTDERVFYNNNFHLAAKLEPADIIIFNKIAGIELASYNQLISILGSQFNRDYTFFSNIDQPVINMFGSMCHTFVDIYNFRKQTDNPFFEVHKEILDNMSNNVKFILTEASKLGPILPDVNRRMGMSILAFYIQQAGIRSNNKKISISEDGDIQYNAPCDSLPTVTSFNKNHLQIPRKFCKVNKTDAGTFITIPYLKKPIQVFPKNKALYVANWNYFVLKQKDKTTNADNQWHLDFKKIKDDKYLFKYIDRLGKSGIFEMGKRLY